MITIGDSHAFGWGVEQNESFSDVLETQWGEKVLNLSVSSYGTAREIKLLERFHPHELDVLIIQYCENDYDENLSASRSDGTLQTMDLAEYRKISTQHRKDILYFPGKHSLGMSFLLAERIRIELTYFFGKGGMIEKNQPPVENVPAREQVTEAKAFVNILRSSTVDFSKTKIIVFEINAHNSNDGKFITALKKEIIENDYPQYMKNMCILDLSGTLRADDYYILDDHMRPSGHRKIAEAIRAVLSQKE